MESAVYQIASKLFIIFFIFMAIVGGCTLIRWIRSIAEQSTKEDDFDARCEDMIRRCDVMIAQLESEAERYKQSSKCSGNCKSCKEAKE